MDKWEGNTVEDYNLENVKIEDICKSEEIMEEKSEERYSSKQDRNCETNNDLIGWNPLRKIPL